MTVSISQNQSDLYSKLWASSLYNFGLVDRNIYEGSVRIILDTFHISSDLPPYSAMLGAKMPTSCNILDVVLINTDKNQDIRWDINVVLLSDNTRRAVIHKTLIQNVLGDDPQGGYYSIAPTYIPAEDTFFIALYNNSDVIIPAGTSYIFKLLYTRG